MFEVVAHHGSRPGPTVTVLGGVHGDEEEGVLAVQRLDALLRAAPPSAGRVRTVAVANPPAYAAGTRTSPRDGLNLARCFPGDPHGSATARLAARLTATVIAGSDLLVDLHSAGRHYAMPHFVGYVDGADEVAARAAAAAAAFGAPLLWVHPPPVSPGRSLSAAAQLGVPAIYVEGSGGGSLEATEVDSYVSGVLGVLAYLGMVPEPAREPRPARTIRGDGGDLDAGILAGHDGRFVPLSAAGASLGPGQPIGEVVDAAGAVLQRVQAPVPAMLMFLRRTARVRAGDVLCSLAPIPSA